MIKKVKGGYKAAHCHGRKRGKPLSRRPKSRAAARAQHRAVMANRKKPT